MANFTNEKMMLSTEEHIKTKEELILGIDDEEQGFASPLKARNRDRDSDRGRDRDSDRPSLSDDVMCDASGATDIDFGADEELAG